MKLYKGTSVLGQEYNKGVGHYICYWYAASHPKLGGVYMGVDTSTNKEYWEVELKEGTIVARFSEESEDWHYGRVQLGAIDWTQHNEIKSWLMA